MYTAEENYYKKMHTYIRPPQSRKKIPLIPLIRLHTCCRLRRTRPPAADLPALVLVRHGYARRRRLDIRPAPNGGKRGSEPFPCDWRGYVRRVGDWGVTISLVCLLFFPSFRAHGEETCELLGVERRTRLESAWGTVYATTNRYLGGTAVQASTRCATLS